MRNVQAKVDAINNSQACHRVRQWTVFSAPFLVLSRSLTSDDSVKIYANGMKVKREAIKNWDKCFQVKSCPCPSISGNDAGKRVFFAFFRVKYFKISSFEGKNWDSKLTQESPDLLLFCEASHFFYFYLIVFDCKGQQGDDGEAK